MVVTYFHTAAVLQEGGVQTPPPTPPLGIGTTPLFGVDLNGTGFLQITGDGTGTANCAKKTSGSTSYNAAYQERAVDATGAETVAYEFVLPNIDAFTTGLQMFVGVVPVGNVLYRPDGVYLNFYSNKGIVRRTTFTNNADGTVSESGVTYSSANYASDEKWRITIRRTAQELVGEKWNVVTGAWEEQLRFTIPVPDNMLFFCGMNRWNNPSSQILNVYKTIV